MIFNQPQLKQRRQEMRLNMTQPERKLWQLLRNNQMGYIIQHIGIQEHYNSISKGLIELKDIVYFIGASAVFITLTKLSISSSKWD